MRGLGFLVSSVAVLGITAAFVFSTPAASPAQPAEGEELEAIEQEVYEIAVRIAELNRRLESMGIEKQYSLEVSPNESLRRQRHLELQRFRQMLAPPSPVPEGWTPYEYEGGTYYFIPAESSAFGDE